ncbi:hypothetical protein EMIHUDRAFT_451293 [Emiliania huxleyi CCMP1516]|uniref:CUE domain-containing protein n=2 Tax=Emiliania huxleyi TaxID=2903 RepID=A0A0D3J2J0_EMIH1|nr:hypothetical protein EMIHUDRAFT_451293 [Emiliania huxleyi CCMP1516]EOD17725.1 hypothetical protein EMIHUDRAFT_451293 [Emiliania huxleyi CCMP1516]|eukprot:XP_005770154.1 hypothetical protein EMIHUDRAFT_451293 [Emiliania huxleyi CCMP1516]
MLPSDVSDDDVETLRSIVGDDLPESTLRALLLRSGGDVTAAANSFFDGGVATLSAMEEGGGASPAQPGACSVGDDVLSTLFKTLEDQGKKLAERDQQLDMATRVCEELVKRLRETERTLASADAERAERKEQRSEVEVQTEGSMVGDADPAGGSGLFARYPLLRLASHLFSPLQMLLWLGGLVGGVVVASSASALAPPLQRSAEAAAEGQWRLKQSRMYLEFEERKRRLQEQQMGQRKKLRESCDAALRPLYAEGAAVCSELERLLIVVRDAAVAAVLYQEDGRVRPSPFVEHRLPAAGSFVTLPDGALGRLGQLPRGLVVAREPRDLPEHPPQWAPAPGLRPKGKHPAELPGLVDVSIVQRGGAVVWPHHECSVPVCAITAADSARLRQWHAQWDAHLRARSAEAEGLAEAQRELLELQAEGLSEERLASLQRGIQRYAALARFG